MNLSSEKLFLFVSKYLYRNIACNQYKKIIMKKYMALDKSLAPIFIRFSFISIPLLIYEITFLFTRYVP